MYACEHPDEAGTLIKRTLPITNLAATAQVYRLMRPYVSSPQTPAGSLDPAKVMRGIALLEGGQLIGSGLLTPDRLVAFNLLPRVV